MRNQSKRATDYYAVLGVDDSASAEAIKTAYRRAVMKYHPDRFPMYVQRAWATRRMQQLNEAYAVLKEPERRGEYDQARLRDVQAGGMKSSPAPAPARARLELIDLLRLWNPKAWLAASVLTFVILPWFLVPQAHPVLALVVMLILAVLLPPLVFLFLAWVTFGLWLNYKLSVGFLVQVFRERFRLALDTAQTRRRSLVKGVFVRLALVCGLAAPIVWEPRFVFVGYVFYPILGGPLVAATAELIALLVYARRARRTVTQTEALLRS